MEVAAQRPGLLAQFHAQLKQADGVSKASFPRSYNHWPRRAAPVLKYQSNAAYVRAVAPTPKLMAARKNLAQSFTSESAGDDNRHHVRLRAATASSPTVYEMSAALNMSRAIATQASATARMRWPLTDFHRIIASCRKRVWDGSALLHFHHPSDFPMVNMPVRIIVTCALIFDILVLNHLTDKEC